MFGAEKVGNATFPSGSAVEMEEQSLMNIRRRHAEHCTFGRDPGATDVKVYKRGVTVFKGTQNTANVDEARGKGSACRMVMDPVVVTTETQAAQQAHHGRREATPFP